MPTAREVRNRIRSVKNIGQITRALEAVSASKVRKAQARAMASRAYAEKAWEILLNVQSMAAKGEPLHPLLEERPDVKTVMVVLITSDRGLAGSYNANIIRVAQRFAQRLGKRIQFVTVGRKGRDTMFRAGANVVAQFSEIPAEPTTADISPIARLAIDEYLSGNVDDVFIAYTDFINMLTQRPVVLDWLPLMPYAIEDQVAAEFVKDVPPVTAGASVYEYEPGPEAILNEIVPRFTELQLYQAVLESQASEHAARMVAMRNASDNASTLADDLTLLYNKARQSAITSEILDIVGGANALQQSIDATAESILAADEMARKAAPSRKSAESRPAPRKTGAGKEDDLTKIDGIGPKMATALKTAGISTFATLAATEQGDIEAVIKAAGMRRPASVGTWPEQAARAALGDWDGLKALQKRLAAKRN